MLKHVSGRTSDSHIDIDLMREPKYVLVGGSFEHSNCVSM